MLHLRKPGASAEEMGNFLRKPMEYMPRIVTHELPAGIRFRSERNSSERAQSADGRPDIRDMSVALSLFEEVLKHKSDCNYVFLSPIYDSISKEGYSSAYSCDTLQKAQQAGIIDSKVMALGGITLEHLPEIAALGFGGAVLLGDVWQQAKEAFIPHFLHLKQLSSHPFNF